MWLETPPSERGGEPKKVEVKFNDKTKVVFNGVGLEGTTLAEGQVAQVFMNPDAKDTAVRVLVFVGGGRR